MKYLLWTLQIVLAAIFLFSGGFKLAVPFEEIRKNMIVYFPAWFIHFIGTCEVLGGLGLLLPGIFRIRTGLTPLAAAGLAIITASATVVTVIGGQPALALFPMVVCLLSSYVAYARWRVLPLEGKSGLRAVAGN
jgi:uncharacterized membrane protein YphA (DoxX/SURF4 family)